jgi:hypothetical protein
MSITRTSRFSYFIMAIATAAMASACHSTHLVASWKEPGATPLHFRKAIGVFVTKDEALRRTLEDKIADEFPNTTPSYRVLKSADMADTAGIEKRLRKQGFDGAIVMRVVTVDQRITYTPGTYWYGAPYYGFNSYWGTAWGYPYDPGYVYANQIVTIETQIYSLTNDKLIWAGRSETTDPRTAGRLAHSVVGRVVRALKKDGLLALMTCYETHQCSALASERADH